MKPIQKSGFNHQTYQTSRFIDPSSMCPKDINFSNNKIELEPPDLKLGLKHDTFGFRHAKWWFGLKIRDLTVKTRGLTRKRESFCGI